MMTACFSLEFRSQDEAKKAFSALNESFDSPKGSIKAKLCGKCVNAEIKSDTFTGLRAISTGFLRTARVVYDVADEAKED
jgi:tRNA threonylcarbamoyladenosine modification (KEOPS) complex  Pcc1 subunit